MYDGHQYVSNGLSHGEKCNFLMTDFKLTNWNWNQLFERFFALQNLTRRLFER